MDTTQLITLLKNAGLSEEAIDKKLNEWANTIVVQQKRKLHHGEPMKTLHKALIKFKKIFRCRRYESRLKRT